MNSRILPLFIASLSLAACAEAPAPLSAEQQFIDDVATAMGGAAAIEATTSIAMEGGGSMLNVGQDLTPEAATMEFTISDYQLVADLTSLRSRTELTRTPLFDYFRGRDPMRLISGIDGDVAYDVAPDGTARRGHDDVAEDRMASYYHHPLPLVRTVLTGGATVGNVRDEDGMRVADITITSGKGYELVVNAADNRPASIRSTDHHFYLRDTVRTTTFSDYESVGDLMLPTVLSQSFDEFHVFRLEATAQELNVDTSGAAAPAEAASAARISGTSPANVTAEVIGDGVWMLAGQSHHSVLIEFSDHLMLVEAPNETRTLAVIEKAEELVPGKPVTKLVNTHHHFDHSGGNRTAVAKGLTIVTQAANEAFYRRMAEQPSTLKPDTLSESPVAIDIEVVEDQRTYADDSMTVEIYHVAGSPHSSSILMTYVPSERLLIQADLFNPGRTTPQTFSPNLLENIENYGLDVERIAPIHGGVVGFEELEAAVEVALAAR